MPNKFKVAAAQMCSGMDVAQNLETISDLASEARAKGADYLLTPEVCVAFLKNTEQLKEIAGPYEGNAALVRCAEIAREHELFLHIGSLAIAVEGQKFANRSVLFSPDGAVVDFYDKINLFDANLPGDRIYRESDTYVAGNREVVCDLDRNKPDSLKLGSFKLGMSICYDVRFPALYNRLAQAGADIISIPSAFTQTTGEAHWQVLVRARAIETGCYIVAAAQGGVHQNGRATFGHSMIVGPWGEVLAERSGQSSGVIVAEIDRNQITIAATKLPVLAK